MRNFSKVLAAGATAIILAGTATAANAADDPVNVIVTPGSLYMSVAPLTAFEAPINVKGTTVLKQDMTVTVEDSRGSNAGWTVYQSVSDISYFGDGAGSLGGEAFQVQGLKSMTQELNEEQTTPAPGTAPSFTGGNGDLGFGQTILTAAPGTGAGKYTVVADLAVMIPRSTEPGTYSGTLNTNIVSGIV